MTEMKDRIKEVMEAKHMSQQTFANFIGINAASLSSIFNNRTKPTLNTVEAIKKKIPNLNTDWLMFGHGEMFDGVNPSATAVAGDTVTEPSSYQPSAGVDAPDLFSAANDTPSAMHRNQREPAPVHPEIRYIERPQRQITEIRIYFDDLTYETFVPKK